MNRRLKALDLMQKLVRQDLDVLARDLTVTRQRQADADAAVSALDLRAGAEARSDLPEALPYVGRFLAELRREQGRQRNRAQEAGLQADRLQGAVSSHYARERSYDRIATDLRAARALSAARLEEAANAEMALSRFSRQELR